MAISADHINANLMRGASTVLVLTVLEENSVPGFAIADEIARRSEGLLEFREGTLYALLQSMERKGLIDSALVESPDKRPRRIYSITDRGRQELSRHLESWTVFEQAVRRVILAPRDHGG